MEKIKPMPCRRDQLSCKINGFFDDECNYRLNYKLRFMYVESDVFGYTNVTKELICKNLTDIKYEIQNFFDTQGNYESRTIKKIKEKRKIISG